MSSSEPVARAKGVSKEFPGAPAVDGIDWDIMPGEPRSLFAPFAES